ncbi:hypothetical protein CHLRE_07g333252v5 [Chlamydomonas reinhardtii]|uniref:Uncharacterized protein n=1 Tax=Chlamydomonas reinhardtii TaxID=3055 RepID=A0A2K3DK13_CHLRE|nr:uncharacterized protein CHLRE_07g333252v5 [Chlamydomonas reinhardtii]PNW80875.1 hypothetical protein CHLRE_07g333252v5 [Chlamydomonas reinhardtii]
MLGEVVVGMGETLVGNYPGRALGFTADLLDGGSGAGPTLVSLPSKRTALRAPGAATLIARSDANAEDLEQYAAAGLYDSVTLQPLVSTPPDYASEPLMGDPGARTDMLGRLTGLGKTVQVRARVCVCVCVCVCVATRRRRRCSAPGHAGDG